jgi:ribosomal protein S27E
MATRHPRGPRWSRPRDNVRSTRSVSAVDRPTSRWVRVTCPECGVVRVRADHVVVRNCLDDESWSYRARCSECDTVFIGITPAELALPAVAAGIAVELWVLPVSSPRHSGAPIHAVDALELHLALLEPDWFEQLARVEPLGDR